MNDPIIQFQNARAFKSTLNELAREAKKSGAEIIRQQAKLLVSELIKLTPPTRGKGNEVKGVTTKQQEKVGKAAVERDINKVVGALNDLHLWKGTKNKGAAKKAINKAIKAGDMETAAAIVGGKKKVTVATTIPKDFHKKFRNARGRIRKPNERLYVPSRATKKAYIQEAQKSVMKGKAGWIKAARRLKSTGLIASITQHPAKGYIRDASKDTSETPSITVANLVKHVQEGGRDLRIISYAMKRRSAAMRKSLQEMYGRKAKRTIRKWTSQGLVTPR